MNKEAAEQLEQSPAAETAHSISHSGFRINYNFNTHQLREVEIIFVADHKRYGQLTRGDILLQINGRNVDSLSEKELNKYLVNSSNPRAPSEYVINYLTIYRPFIEDQINYNENNVDTDDNGSSSHQENGDLNENNNQNNANGNNNNHNNGNNGNDSSSSNNNSSSNGNGSEQHTTNNKQHADHPYVGAKARLLNGTSNETNELNAPIGSSTPMRAKEQEMVVKNGVKSSNSNSSSSEYPVEEIKIMKCNGAMGLSIVGGGNIACHPFGIERPGIFISKIVPDGPASRTNLRVGDRLLRVNNIDVTQLSHDECVDELKRNPHQVNLFVSHDPQPDGLQEVILHRSYPEETLGIRINGGIENKSANVYDSSDEGIFVVNLINGTLAHKDGRLKVGTRIMEVGVSVQLKRLFASLFVSLSLFNSSICPSPTLYLFFFNFREKKFTNQIVIANLAY
jgi:hypothetical protein